MWYVLVFVDLLRFQNKVIYKYFLTFSKFMYKSIH